MHGSIIGKDKRSMVTSDEDDRLIVSLSFPQQCLLPVSLPLQT